MSGNVQTYHIMGEVLALTAVLYYTYSQNSKLIQRIETLEKRLERLERAFTKPTTVPPECPGGVCAFKPSAKPKTVTFESMVEEVEYEGGVSHNVMVHSPSAKVAAAMHRGGATNDESGDDKELQALLSESIRGVAST